MKDKTILTESEIKEFYKEWYKLHDAFSIPETGLVHAKGRYFLEYFESLLAKKFKEHNKDYIDFVLAKKISKVLKEVENKIILSDNFENPLIAQMNLVMLDKIKSKYKQ